MKKLNFWNKFEIGIWILFLLFTNISLLVFEKKIIELNMVTSISWFVIFLLYFIKMFGSFSMWRASIGIPILYLFYYTSHIMILLGIFYSFLDWEYVTLGFALSIIALCYGLVATLVYYFFKGRKHKQFFNAKMRPVFFRTIFTFIIMIYFIFMFDL